MRGGTPAREPDGWRAKAVERSLRDARARAVSRSERFISVATELLYETGSLDFTVSELVERSRMSLRSFYQHFASKEELLLAVFEEAIRDYVDELGKTIDATADPVEKLRTYVTGFFGAGESGNRDASAALSRYLLGLTTTNPSEVARVLEPQVRLLRRIIDAGIAAGRFRTDIPPAALTLLITHTVTSAVEMNVLGTQLTGSPVTADELWEFCSGGVTAGTAATAGRPRRVSPRE